MLMEAVPVKAQTVLNWLQVTGVNAVQHHHSAPHFYSLTTLHTSTWEPFWTKSLTDFASIQKGEEYWWGKNLNSTLMYGSNRI